MRHNLQAVEAPGLLEEGRSYGFYLSIYLSIDLSIDSSPRVSINPRRLRIS
jgi:hypothetical protein